MRKLMMAFVVAALAFVAWVPGAGAATTSVTMSGTGCAGGSLYCYNPANVTVHDGDTVVWTNQSAAPHTVTRCTTATCAGTGPGTGTDATFTNGNIAAGNGPTFSHTFHGAGTYAYTCTIHGFAVMHGTVTVLAASTGGTTPATVPTAPAAAPGAPAAPAAPAPAAASSGSSQPASANASAQAQGSNGALAFTGAHTALWAITGAVLLAAGLLLALVTRRARRAVPPLH